MRIGIDCRTILNPVSGERAGVGYYTYYLVKNLLSLDKANEYVLFFDSRFKNTGEFEQDNVKIRFFPFYQYKQYLPITYSQMLVSAVLAKENLDLFHAPANTIPLFYNGRSVVTVHDLAIYKYPNLFPKVFLNRQLFSTKILVPRSAAKAEKVIAVSKNTKRDVVEQLNVAEDKVEVVYEGVISHGKSCPHQADINEVKKKYGIKDKYFMFLGTIEPRKNILGLIKAFRNLSLAYDSPIKDYQLVIAGGIGWNDKNIYEAIVDANASILGKTEQRFGKERRSGFDSRTPEQRKEQGERRCSGERRLGMPVKHIGYVSQAEKISLMNNTACFIFPSLYEGFGLPVLEAMSLGAPIITSKTSSLPEVTGDKAAVLIDPYQESEMIEAMTQIVTDQGLRESLSINGQERAKFFDWKTCAEETLRIYQEAVK